MVIDEVDEPGADEDEEPPPDDSKSEVESERVGDKLHSGVEQAKIIESLVQREQDGKENKVEFRPDDQHEGASYTVRNQISKAAAVAATVYNATTELIEGTAPAIKDEYTWAHFKWEYYYDDEGNPPTEGDETVIPFDPSEYLGFDLDAFPNRMAQADDRAQSLSVVYDKRTVNIQANLDEDAFFSNVEGFTTITNRYDLEKAVPMEKKEHFVEEERYWVNKPYAFVIIFHSRKENEKKYYLVEPYNNPVEEELKAFLKEKLRTAIKYAEEGVVIEGSDDERREVIQRETDRLLSRYNLYDGPGRDDRGFIDSLFDSLNLNSGDGYLSRLGEYLIDKGIYEPTEDLPPKEIGGLSARPEPVLLEEDRADLTEYQVEKLRYSLTKDFIGYERIDGIKHDINVEDISCDGYNSPVFAYHTDYEQLITNIQHGDDQLDDFVVKMAQRAGKGISKRQPQVDATLPDGSRAQLTLGTEVSDHGTNYTIRQFKDVPFTPVDLINWKTFSLEEMAFLWLCIENNKSLLFAGGTASGKTTSLNAVSLFVPSNAKIVSIEDTREVELPQRNWIASVTRPSFGESETGDIDEFDLLEAALRQRPDYIIMGEVRGEEGRTLFQVMSTGHTTYTTFHADNVSEVIKRFTTDPINVSKTLFTALDLISIQASTRVRGKKVRRSRNITEIRRYDAENDEINVNDVFQWRPETDTYRSTAESTTLDEIKFDRGWTDEELERQQFERLVVLAYLIKHKLNTYTEVAATIQAYINDPDTLLTLIANESLEEALEDLREMESVLIEVDPDKEEMVPRPEADEEVMKESEDILEKAEKELFPEYMGKSAPDIRELLSGVGESDTVVKDEPVTGPGEEEPPTEGHQDAAEESQVTEGVTEAEVKENAIEEETGFVSAAASENIEEVEGELMDDSPEDSKE